MAEPPERESGSSASDKHLAYLRPFYETSWRRRNGRVGTRAD
jgi:hypothetical protein